MLHRGNGVARFCESHAMNNVALGVRTREAASVYENNERKCFSFARRGQKKVELEVGGGICRIDRLIDDALNLVDSEVGNFYVENIVACRLGEGCGCRARRSLARVIKRLSCGSRSSLR